jgi:antirestriction protein ArdC
VSDETTGSATDKVPYYKQVADQLIAKIEQGVAPWQKPWEAGKDYYPYNPTTGKHYRGINAILLMSNAKDDPRWLTYKQAQAIGAQVKRGERGSPIQYWEFEERVPKLDDNGKPVLDANGKEVKETVKLEQPRVIWSTVFNASQIDGMPPLEPKQTHKWVAIENAEKAIADTGAKIEHKEGDKAFYSPKADAITLPQKEQFPNAIGYYQTALHELGHWTGHSSRLNRDLSGGFGSESYAREELRAEIASVMTGARLGIGSTPRDENAAYVQSWIKALKDDPKELYRAASDAEKAAQFLTKSLYLEQTKDKENAIEKPPAITLERSVSELKQSLERSTIAMQNGDYSKLGENYALIDKAANLSKVGGVNGREVANAIDSFSKQLQQSRSTAPIEAAREIHKQLSTLDRQFAQGLSR